MVDLLVDSSPHPIVEAPNRGQRSMAPASA